MDKPLLHTASEQAILAYSANPRGSLLLYGQRGIGVDTAARYLARLMSSQAYVYFLQPDGGTITIEQIRQLYVDTRSKTAGVRIVIVSEADTMQAPAQNAFLKLLEEPSAQTHFILTSHAPQLLLPTIHSRLNKIELLPLSTQQSASLLDGSGLSAQAATQIQFIADGLPAEIIRLRDDEQYRSAQFAAAAIAKDLIGASLFEKLVTVQKLTDRDNALRVINIASHMLAFQLHRQPAHSTAALLDRLQKALTAIEHNGNLKAQLLAAVAL